jgi:hypothetical protein
MLRKKESFFYDSLLRISEGLKNLIFINRKALPDILKDQIYDSDM